VLGAGLAEHLGRLVQVGDRPRGPRLVGALTLRLRAERAERVTEPAVGRRRPDTGSDAPATLSPASSGGSTGSTDSARRGSSPVASSQRPSHPVRAGASGDPVCQMAMDRKWL
jgi:hypothetical protein